jgi:hypothetical protein
MGAKIIPGTKDGVVIGYTDDKVGMYGKAAVPQRSSPLQATVQEFSSGVALTAQANVGAMANSNTITTNEVVITTAVGVAAANDFVMGVSKPTYQAGMGIAGVRANGSANGVAVVLCNPTAANVVPTANEAWAVTVLRGMNVISANLVPANCVTKKTVESEFTISPANAAVATAVISGDGVKYVNVTDEGNGYYTPPTVVFTSANAVTPDPISGGGTGTANGLPGNQGGCGATGIATISGGKVVGVRVTNPGSGYLAAPAVSFIGGSAIAPGMLVQVNKAAAQAGLGIGNVRVSGNSKIAITYFNPTAANITPTANETYKIFATGGLLASSPALQIGLRVDDANAASANASNQTTVTVDGVLATDVVAGAGQSALASPLLFGGGYSAANAVSLIYGGGVPGATPANGVYNVQLWRHSQKPAMKLLSLTVPATTVNANNTANTVITLPGSMAITANTTVVVNKPSHTPGIGVIGAWANASNQVGITFINVTAANIVTPANEAYLVGIFDTVVPPAGSWVAQPVMQSLQCMVDLQNELLQTVQVMGQVKGE